MKCSLLHLAYSFFLILSLPACIENRFSLDEFSESSDHSLQFQRAPREQDPVTQMNEEPNQIDHLHSNLLR